MNKPSKLAVIKEIKVLGGTHIGVDGLFGYRVFNVKNEEDIETIIRKENNLEHAVKSKYKVGRKTVHTLEDSFGNIKFEWEIIKPKNTTKYIKLDSITEIKSLREKKELYYMSNSGSIVRCSPYIKLSFLDFYYKVKTKIRKIKKNVHIA